MKRALILIGLFSFLVTTYAAYASADIKVLVLSGNIANVEFPVLSKFTQVGDQKVSHEMTTNRTLPGLDGADVLWVGHGEICENAYFLDKATENKIKNFVKNGGVVITIGQDSDEARSCETGWLPDPKLLTGFERKDADEFEVNPVPEVRELFKKPNEVKIIHCDDAWGNPGKSVIVLAFIAKTKDVGIGLIPYGHGVYIVTSLENERAGEVFLNTAIMENLIHYAVTLKLAQRLAQAVEIKGKLALSWAKLKIVTKILSFPSVPQLSFQLQP